MATLDLLLIVEERDRFKQYVHAIKSLLATTNVKKIKHHSIFDPDMDRKKILCEKVVILLEEPNSECMEKKWIDELPNVKGNYEKYFLLYLNDKARNVAALPGEVRYSVGNSLDVAVWWADVLIFVFGLTTLTRVGLDVVTIDGGDQQGRQFQEIMASGLQRFQATDETSKPELIVVLCNNLHQNLSDYTELLSHRLDGYPVFVMNTSKRGDLSIDFKRIATRAYRRRQTMTFMFDIFIALGLIDVSSSNVCSSDKKVALRGKITVNNLSLGRKALSLTWNIRPKQIGDIHIRHRTSSDGQWSLLTHDLPRDTAAFEVYDLDINCRHQFQLVQETENGFSEPITSCWFVWHRSFKKKALIVVLFILAVAVQLISIPIYVTVLPLLVLATERRLQKHRYSYYFMPFSIFNGVTLLVCVVLYAVCTDANSPESYMLLNAGLYCILWSIVLHNILSAHNCDWGVVGVPKLLWQDIIPGVEDSSL